MFTPHIGAQVTYGTQTWIWSVVVDVGLYVRGYNGQQSRWYQAAIRQRAGGIRAAGMTKEVNFEPVAGPLNDRIDEAYQYQVRGQSVPETDDWSPRASGDSARVATRLTTWLGFSSRGAPTVWGVRQHGRPSTMVTRSFCMRDHASASVIEDLASRSAGVVIGDLSSAVQTRSVAEQVNAIGHMDAVIHNAGAYSTSGRSPTPEGHSIILAVNTLAPYMLSALIKRPRRLVYLSSGMHRSGAASLRDIDWIDRRWSSSQAYSDSKLYVTALAFAVARAGQMFLAMPSILGGWRQEWAARERRTISTKGTSPKRGLLSAMIPLRRSPAGTGITACRRHQPRKRRPPRFQDQLSAKLAELTGVPLF
jgi:hypothetical protein